MSAERVAGRELDEQVCRALGIPFEPPCPKHHKTDDAEFDSQLGWMGWCYTCRCSISEVADEAPRVSSDISAAFLVVEAMRERGFTVCTDNTAGDRWFAEFFRAKSVAYAYAEQAPLALCVAALAALDAMEGR